MERCPGRCDITEIMLKTVSSTIKSIYLTSTAKRVLQLTLITVDGSLVHNKRLPQDVGVDPAGQETRTHNL